MFQIMVGWRQAVESISDPLKHLVPSLFCIMRTNLAGKLQNRTNMAEGDGICYADSLENALGIVRDYELRTTTKFTIYKKLKAFGNTGTFLQKMVIHYTSQSPAKHLIY